MQNKETIFQLNEPLIVNAQGLANPTQQNYSEAKRVRDDVKNALTLVQVWIGLDIESQKDIKLSVYRQWIECRLGKDFEALDSAKQNLNFQDIWIACWNKRELKFQAQFMRWYSIRLQDINKSKYSDKTKRRKQLMYNASLHWENMHCLAVFDTSSSHFEDIMHAFNL